MREKAEAKAKGGQAAPAKAKPEPPRELSFMEQIQEQRRIMKEKAEAKRKALEGTASTPAEGE